MLIWKYTWPDWPRVQSMFAEFDMPKDAEILCAQAQDNTPRIWARVDPSQDPVKKKFVIAATGAPLEKEAETGKYIGTCLMWNDSLVMHVFEVLP